MKAKFPIYGDNKVASTPKEKKTDKSRDIKISNIFYPFSRTYEKCKLCDGDIRRANALYRLVEAKGINSLEWEGHILCLRCGNRIKSGELGGGEVIDFLNGVKNA